jgi:hypothetical protein
MAAGGAPASRSLAGAVSARRASTARVFSATRGN